VLVQRRRVLVAELVQELRRAFHVSEEERDDTYGKARIHEAIMANIAHPVYGPPAQEHDRPLERKGSAAVATNGDRPRTPCRVSVAQCLGNSPRRLAATLAIGFVGNEIAAQVRLRGGRRLSSPALIADGSTHAFLGRERGALLRRSRSVPKTSPQQRAVSWFLALTDASEAIEHLHKEGGDRSCTRTAARSGGARCAQDGMRM
jgi:hypothetical protein